MTTPDLQALINQPGAGTAARALIEAGYWDAHADAGPLRPFAVELSGDVTLSVSIAVSARCEAEAIEKARADATDGLGDWDRTRPAEWHVSFCQDCGDPAG